ncbi:hypothetical protein NL108_011440 [Boleophthalmus pectinirostris]|nr:hypothetical protein NL108_011440 [Boleophthalmus pectinirostris]
MTKGLEKSGKLFILWEKRGVAILVRKGTPFVAEKVIQDTKGRYVLVVGQIRDKLISVLNIYAPNEENELFFKTLVNIMIQEEKGMLVLGGDFNTVQNGKLDKLPSEKGAPTSRSKMLNNIIKELGLIDPWRSNNTREKAFTFYSNPHNSYSRIDFFLLSQQDVFEVISSGIEPITISDHAPIHLTIELDKDSSFKYWRLGVSILADKAVVQEIKESIIQYIDNNDNGEVNLTTLWECGKAVIRGKIIELTSRIKKKREQQQKLLENEIKKLETEHTKTLEKSIMLELKEARSKLDKLVTFKVENAIRYMNQTYYEKRNRAKNVTRISTQKETVGAIAKIRPPVSKEIKIKPTDVAEAFADYYRNLYDDQSTESLETKIQMFMNKFDLPTLTPEQ